MAHRRGGSSRGRGISQSQRRKTKWVSFGTDSNIPISIGIINEVGNQVTGTEVTATAFIADPMSEGLQESTILRIRGSLFLRENKKAALLSNRFSEAFAYGIGVVTQEAAEAGAVPNPASVDGASWDGWMFYRSQMEPNIDAQSTVIDVKAMRKLESGYTLVFVLGAVFNDAYTAVQPEAQLAARILFMLA